MGERRSILGKDTIIGAQEFRMAVGRELKFRQDHYDSDVRAIASSLSEILTGDNSWVRNCVDSEFAKGYSPVELAILLEKVSIRYTIGDLWDLALADSPIFPGSLEGVRAKLRGVNWTELLANVPREHWANIVGEKTVKTNLFDRYKVLTEEILVPAFGNKELNVVDAGASGGFSFWCARESGLSIGSWIAADVDRPDYPWILTCSIRASEILGGGYERYLDALKQRSSAFRFIVCDIKSLSMKDNTNDLYLAVFSWYQLENHKAALEEARRVVRPGGVILVTDNISWNGATPNFCNPWDEGDLSTIAYFKGRSDSLDGPHPVAYWKSPNLAVFKPASGYSRLMQLSGFGSANMGHVSK